VSYFKFGVHAAGVALVHANILPGNTNAVTIAAGSGGNTVFSDNIGYP